MFLTQSVSIGISFCFFVLILIISIWKWRRSSSRGNTVVLAGLMNSGKTLLFIRMRDACFRSTVTSLSENEDFIFVKAKKSNKKEMVHLVDTPGHERLRHKLRQFLPISRGVVFVIDSVDFEIQARQVAEFLYELLINRHVYKKKIPLLIACNKKDIVTATGSKRIQTVLEEEIDQLRKTVQSIPRQNEEENSEEISLGMREELFQFGQLENLVQFVECSAKESQIEDIVDFTYTCVR